MSELPKGWAAATLGDVTAPRGEKADPKSLGDIPFLGMDHIEAHTANLLGSQLVSELKSAVAVFKKGDLLYGRLRPYLNKVHLAGFDGAASAEFIVFPPSDAIKQRFLQSLLRRPEYRVLADNRSTGDRPRVKFDNVSDFEFSLPPLAEQKRIVRKLDTLSARTATARTHLTAIAKLVERQKLAVLGHLFGKSGSDPKPTEHLWAIPTSWEWKKVKDIGEVGLGRQRSPENHQGPDMRPYIRSANITWSGLDTTDVKEMNFDEADFERFELKVGDVLLNEGSGSAKEVGKPAIWRGEIPNCCFQNTVLRVQPRDCSSEYLYWYFLLTALSEGFVKDTKGVNIQHIGKGGLANFPIPVPPSDEQDEIVLRIEAALTEIDRIAAEAEKALKLTDRLDERILAKAFAGELVPQNPNDEPASVLLARIREARASAPAKKPRQKPQKKTEKLMSRKIEEVLADAGDWLPSQEAFRRCGISDGAETDAIELIYAELRELEQSGRLDVEAVADDQGRKLHDRLKLKAA